MLFEFTREFVFSKEIESRELVDDYLLQCISERKGQLEEPWSLCNAQSSYLKPPAFNEFIHNDLVLDNVLWNPLDEMIQEVCSFSPTPEYSKCTEAWYNIYNTGSFQEIHDHKTRDQVHDGNDYYSSYSAIYILKDGGVPNSTVFSKKVDILGPIPINRQVMNTGSYDNIKSGVVVIFPSTLDHFVLPHIGVEDRITLSFNIHSYYG